MAEFKGLNTDAFAAYSTDKWSSNVHNLTRMRVKDLLIALCDHAGTLLKDELSGLQRAVSDEVPNIVNKKKVDAQWVYWFRDQTARENLASFLQKTPLDQKKLFEIAPQDKHITLAVVLRETEIRVGLRIASGAIVDHRNLKAILGKAWEREQFLELLKDLPDGARIGHRENDVPVSDVSLDALMNMGHELTDDGPAWRLGHALSPDEAISLGEDLADQTGRWLGALTPIYRFLAWDRDNDHIDVNRQLQEEKAQKRRQALGYNPGDKVRIISGVFSGKIGIVQNIDTKAQVKVQVGKMSVVVAGTGLTPVN